jgi:hypothetical protein
MQTSRPRRCTPTCSTAAVSAFAVRSTGCDGAAVDWPQGVAANRMDARTPPPSANRFKAQGLRRLAGSASSRVRYSRPQLTANA